MRISGQRVTTHCGQAIDVAILRTLALSRPRHGLKKLFIVLGIAQVLLQLFHRFDLIHFVGELAQDPRFCSTFGSRRNWLHDPYVGSLGELQNTVGHITVLRVRLKRCCG